MAQGRESPNERATQNITKMLAKLKNTKREPNKIPLGRISNENNKEN